MLATGGTITYIGNDVVHKFTSNGTFTVTQTGTARVLVVGGGGGGGGLWSGVAGSGGGGGGYRYEAAYNFTTTGNYTITIGAGGGAEGYGGASTIRDPSNIAILGAAGGARGAASGANGGNGTSTNGQIYGSSGGGGRGGTGTGGGLGGTAGSGAGSKGQGAYGENSDTASLRRGGGGGGAGGHATTGVPRHGGNGIVNDIDGTSRTYAGGGGGGTGGAVGTVGLGTGGTGVHGGSGGYPAFPNGSSGWPNTGTGGGGAWSTGTPGNGGSGVVIIRYTPDLTQNITMSSGQSISSAASVSSPTIINTQKIWDASSIEPVVSFGTPIMSQQYVIPITESIESQVSFGSPYIGDATTQFVDVADEDSIESIAEVGEPQSIHVGLPKDTLDIEEYITGQHGPVYYTYGMRYYDETQAYLGVLDNTLISATLKWDSSATIKRSIDFEIQHNCQQIPNAYYVEPYAILHYTNHLTHQDEEELFLLGTYQITSKRTIVEAGLTKLRFTGQDRTLWLHEATVEETLTLHAGGNVGTAIRQLFISQGFADYEIDLPATSINIPTTLTFEAGTTYYHITSQLADSINWTQPFMSNTNRLTCLQRVDLTLRQPDVAYATDHTSVVLPDVAIETTEVKVNNQIRIAVNDPLRAPFTVTFNNDSLANPYSRVVTGRTITLRNEELNYIANETVALERAKLIAQEESATTKIELKTWPDFRRKPHEIYNVVVTCSVQGTILVQDMWECLSWSLNLQTGGDMTHQIRSILPVT